MRFIFALATAVFCLVFGSYGAGSAEVIKDPAALTWTTVDAPVNPMVYANMGFNVIWKYPFDTPCPAGTYEVCNAVVDRSQQVGAWSQPKVITAKAGWQLLGGTWNQPVVRDDVGIIWKVKCLQVPIPSGAFVPGAELRFTANPYPNWTAAPYSGDSYEVVPLINSWQNYGLLSSYKMGGRNVAAAPPPIALPTSFPYKPFEVAYCRVTETGETALSGVLQVNPAPAAGMLVPPEVGSVQLNIRNDPHPQGTIGYHIYVRFLPTDPWQRVPATHCYGEPQGPDDWLFQWYDNQPVLNKLASNPPTHNPVANPQSRLNDLQVQLKTTNGDIVVPNGITYDCYCPVIDEYGPGNNKAFRVIAPATKGKWTLDQKQSQSGHTYWPMLCVYNQYSTWEDVQVKGSKGASAALTFADWSGGQAFGNKFRRCSFGTNFNPAGVTFGMLVSTKCSQWWGDHTASELVLDGCGFMGTIGVGLEGNQTANVRFINETYINCHATDRRGSVYWSTVPNQVSFGGGLFCDSTSGIIFRCGWILMLDVDKIWIDQGFDHLIDATNNSAVNVSFTKGKLNAWGYMPNIARLVELNGNSAITFDKVVPQMNTMPYDMPINNGQYNMLDLRFTDSTMADLAILREPTEKQTKDAWAVIYYNAHPYPAGRPELGYKITIPATTIDQQPLVFQTLATTFSIPASSRTVKLRLPGQTVDTNVVISDPIKDVVVPGQKITLKREPVVVPAKTLTFNSFTGRQNVRRADWTSVPTPAIVLP